MASGAGHSMEGGAAAMTSTDGRTAVGMPTSFVRDLQHRYVIDVRRDLRRYRLRPWWATMTHNLFYVGDFGGGVWRARTREGLIAKCEKRIARDMLRNGMAGDAEVTVQDR
jgi:hypothetical protein